MHFEDAEIEQHSSTPNNKSKVLGVIVLTDNRQHSPTHKHRTQKEFRGSGYKDTEIDPIDLQGDPSFCQDQNTIMELSRRLAFLQARVEALSKNEVISTSGEMELQGKKKKNRRRFRQLVRDQECPFCRKLYGSQTSLKYHLKLKHKTQRNHSQVQ